MRKLGLGDVYYATVEDRRNDASGIFDIFSEVGIESELGGYVSPRIESMDFERFEGIRYGSVTYGDSETFVVELYVDGILVSELLYEIYNGRESTIGMTNPFDHDKEKEVTIALYEETIRKIKSL